MKVPTYKRQAESVSGAITPRVTAQASPKALGAQAEVLSNIGELLFNAGTEKLRIHAESQALKANKAMEVELRAIADDAVNQDITVYTPAEVQKKMDDVYTKYANGLAIDSATGKSYLSTSNARTAFQAAGYETYQGYISNYRKNSNKMMAKQAEINIVSRVQDEVKVVADISIPEQSRLAALGNLMSTDEIYDNTLGLQRRRGLLVYSATSGVMTAEKTTALMENTFEEIALGTALSYMGDDSYAEVASDFVDGDLEAKDAVLGAVLAELSPEQREALNRKVIDYANKNVTRLEEEDKERNEAIQSRLDNQFTQMINVADENLPQAKLLFENLKDNNYFKSVASLNSAKKLLGMVDENDSPTDDMDVIARLYDLASTKELTIEEVNRVANRLPKSFKKFYDLALTFAADGTREGGQVISSGIGYDKYKDVKGIGNEANMFYQRAINEFTQWRTRKPDPGQPLSGGLGATYEVIIEKAQQISDRFSTSLKASIQNQFNKEYDTIVSLISGSKLGNYQVIGNDRKRSILSWFESLTQQQREETDVLVVWDTFRKFENEDVR